eukprot:jgi/Picsp_1/3582/NSC_06419-R1_protein
MKGKGRHAGTQDLLPRSPTERVQVRLQIHLHPSKLLSIDLGVHEHINSLLLRYNEEIEGIPIAYFDHKILSSTALISSYFPLCKVAVLASFVIVKPVPGQFLHGRVTEVSDSFIGVLVLNFINCVIRIDDIRSEFSYSVFGQTWTSKAQSEHRIKINDTVRFQVLELNTHGGFATIIGSLKQAGTTGNVTHISYNANDIDIDARGGEGKDEKKKRKRKKKGSSKRGRQDADPANDPVDDDKQLTELAEAQPKKKKKKKKEKEKEGKREKITLESKSR